MPTAWIVPLSNSAVFNALTDSHVLYWSCGVVQATGKDASSVPYP